MEQNKNELIKLENVIETFSPSRMIRTHKHIQTIANASDSESMALSGLAKACGEDSIQALVELHLWSLYDSIGQLEKVKEIQIVEMATEIMSSYYWFKMEDIYLIFRMAKRGEFGQIYGTLSMLDILGWFAKYDDQRTALFVERSTAHRHTDHSPRSSQRDSDAMHLARLTDFTNKTKKS